MHHGVFLEAHVHEDFNGRLDVLNQRSGLRLPQLFPLLGEQVLIVVVYLYGGMRVWLLPHHWT